MKKVLYGLSQDNRGFSLLEMVVVIVIAGILAAIAVPSYLGMIKKHKLTQYATEMEYLVKSAKIIAMERTVNTGICVDSSTNLILYIIGTSRSAGICSGTEFRRMTINATDASYSNISLSGSGASFDPRGLAIWTGNVCITNNEKYVKACISRTGIRIEEGSGGCSSCSF
ncbi:MAG: prepilin-type N-terminal cleavage/methylation domain-containing protein [Syntrophorhabdaceae bacterium]|nr:prepilin-type N-terminal cleavage/methylation domain-containing protein [Syntrophorhabdaceae bacterium]